MAVDWLKLMNGFRTAALAQDAQALDDLARGWAVVERAISGDAEALALQIDQARRDGKPIPISYLTRTERYNAMLANLQDSVSSYINGPSDRIISGTQSSLATLGAQQARGAIQAYGVKPGSFTKITSTIIESVITATRSGSPLAVLLSEAYPTAASAITDIFTAQITKGTNPRQVARQVINQGLAQGLNRVLLVSRDQGVRAWRNTAQAQYQRSGVVDSYRRVAARGPRTCPACLALDGKIYLTNELMPLHPQCRCALIPNVRGFPPIGMQSGAAWLAQQPAETQKEILGPGRYELYKNGVPLEAMAATDNHPTWGPTVRVATVEELTNR